MSLQKGTVPQVSNQEALSAQDIANAQSVLSINPTATTNQTDAFLLSRENHTGTQPSTTITNAINVNNSQGGSITLDLDIPSEYWNLTSNSFINNFFPEPEEGFSIIKNIKITTATGTETVSFPAGWDIYGIFDPNKKNKLTIEISQTELLTFDVDVFINQPN